jgi:pYEATS domain-containing protein involved in immunity/TIR domain-containing protein
MAEIFISYRRSGDEWAAGRICDRLEREFGNARVFFDTMAIQPGDDFVDTIGTKIDACEVLLAVIGPTWLDNLARRLLDPNDFLRVEISEALKRGVRVVPVLVDGSRMPPDESLPEELKLLSRRQGISIRGETFRNDIDTLVEFLRGFLGEPSGGPLAATGSDVANSAGALDKEGSPLPEVPEAIRRDIQLVHRAKFWKKMHDKEFWRLFISLAEPNPTTLRAIDKIVYHLHSTFSNPTRGIFDKKSNFELKTSAWGEFEIFADVFFTADYKPIRISRYLNFR